MLIIAITIIVVASALLKAYFVFRNPTSTVKMGALYHHPRDKRDLVLLVPLTPVRVATSNAMKDFIIKRNELYLLGMPTRHPNIRCYSQWEISWFKKQSPAHALVANSIVQSSRKIDPNGIEGKYASNQTQLGRTNHDSRM